MKIAILTSGGDSPGMNAAIINLIVAASKKKNEVLLIRDGFNGLLDNNFIALENNVLDYYDYLYRSGSFIGSTRSKRFPNEVSKAVDNLVNYGVNLLVVIGGNGSYLGAKLIAQKIQVIFIPASIDNDVTFTDYCLGFSSCCNEIVQQTQKIVSTFKTHQNVVIIEVMGRYCSDLVNCTSQALLPAVLINHETNYKLEEIITKLKEFYQIHHFAFVLLAENIYSSSEIETLRATIEQNLHCAARFNGLGYSQRGATVDCNDLSVANAMANLAINEATTTKDSFAVVKINGNFVKKLFQEIKD